MRFDMIRAALVVGGVAVCASTAAQAAGTAADAFNRAKLGTTWKAVSGTIGITKNQFTGSTGALGSLTGTTGTAGSAVVSLGGTDLEYGAVAVGNVAGGTNAFVKIQAQNGTGQFDHGGFYTGNNSGSDFFSLTAPVSSPATIDVAFCKTKAYLRITSASGVQTYSYDYGTTFGGGGGLGTYGSVALDNYISYKGTCSTLSHTAIAVEGLPHDRDLSR